MWASNVSVTTKNISEEKSLEILSIIYLSQTQTVSNCGWKYPQQNATNSFQIFSFKNVLGFCPVLYLENLFSQTTVALFYIFVLYGAVGHIFSATLWTLLSYIVLFYWIFMFIYILAVKYTYMQVFIASLISITISGWTFTKPLVMEEYGCVDWICCNRNACLIY